MDKNAQNISVAGLEVFFEDLLGKNSRVGVALSGGCDSALVLAMVCRVLGPENVVAVTASTVLQFPCDTESASQVARHCGCEHIVEDTTPLSDPAIQDNPPERCYLCKKKSYARFYDILAKQGCAVLLDGTNLDDLSDDRPGLRALRELGVLTPLAAAGLRKQDARQIARQIGLENWDRPSASCLATRIPHNTPLTHQRLEMVRVLEEELLRHGFRGCRVRLDGKTARLELIERDFRRFLGERYRGFLMLCKNVGLQEVYLNLAARSE